jgi:hypothetical protein
VQRFHASFSYQAKSWSKSRRVVAKVEWHPGELYPRVGFIVTNLSRPPENIVAFYNQRGTCEQWIKEGKGAVKWTRLSCRLFSANSVRLQLHALAYNLGNFLRTLATPEPIKNWSLTSLREKLVKIGAKVVRHGRYVIFPDGRGRGAEGLVPGDSAADRRTAIKTGPSVGTATVGCVITTGGVCCPKPCRRRLMASVYPSRMLAFTLIPGHLGNVGSNAVVFTTAHESEATAPTLGHSVPSKDASS